jgi:hypothetical protein
MGPALEVVVSDGIAFAHAGDTALIVYASPARLLRTRWLFDRLDEMTARVAHINILLIVLPSADVPDADTRAENTRRMGRLRGRLRRVITVVIGDSMRLTLVRTIMRAMFLVQGQSRVQSIVNTIDEGMELLLSTPTPNMPERAQLTAALTDISHQLQCPLL